MNPWLLIFVSLCYGGTGVQYMLHGEWAWGVFWMSYAVANSAYIVAVRVP